MTDKNDVRLLYQVLSSQIEFSKTQQWTMAYYSLLFIGGLVGFSELIYRDLFQSSPFAQLVLFFLAVAIPPVTMVCLCLLWKNRESMSKCRKHFQKMWPYLSWPFDNGEEQLDGRPLIGGGIDSLPIYRSAWYDAIFWSPTMSLTSLAGVFSYVYLLVKFWNIGKIDPLWILLNIVTAIGLSFLLFRIYSHWDCSLKRRATRAQKKECKDTSLPSIAKRIRSLFKWIRTGQIPPCDSCLHRLMKCICKGQGPTEANKTSQL